MTIELSEYNPEWTTMFDTEKNIISTSFPIHEVIIEHIGSTSIPDLKAKPIIDIMLGLTELPVDISPIVNYFKTLGYEYIAEYDFIIPERPFFKKT
ncbi:MAG: GrpB family protein [Bacteroidetes bacterium]|nr:GrpB family protein [Bacteroidota bacterium]